MSHACYRGSTIQEVSPFGLVVVVVLAGAGITAWRVLNGRSPSTLSGGGLEQPGASGLPERIFFALFGAPRDLEKERQLSWRRAPHVPRQLPTGFTGRGADRRW